MAPKYSHPKTKEWRPGQDSTNRRERFGIPGQSPGTRRAAHRDVRRATCDRQQIPQVRNPALPEQEHDGTQIQPSKNEGMAPRAGFEPATYRLGGDCSIRLSYRGDAGVANVFTRRPRVQPPQRCPHATTACSGDRGPDQPRASKPRWFDIGLNRLFHPTRQGNLPRRLPEPGR